MGRKRISDSHLPQRMYLRSGSYYFVDHLGKWHNLGRVYSKAMAEYVKFTDPDTPCRTISDLIDRYLKEVAPTKAESTYKGNLKQAKYLRAGLGHIHTDRLTTQLVYQYMDARGRTTPTSANRELSLLSHMYTKAIRWGAASYNPCLGVERFKEKPRDRYVTDAEFIAFRDFAGDLIAAYMDFKLLTGLRRKDILEMKLDQIKEDGIHCHISKGKKNQIFEWTPALIEAVENIKKLRRKIYGFYLFSPTQGINRGQKYTDDGFSSIWQRKMDKALKEGILSEKFTDHDIRAKSGSDTSLEHATKLLSHQSSKITQRHYRRQAEKVKPLK